jgi:hypothetical protein
MIKFLVLVLIIYYYLASFEHQAKLFLYGEVMDYSVNRSNFSNIVVPVKSGENYYGNDDYSGNQSKKSIFIQPMELREDYSENCELTLVPFRWTRYLSVKLTDYLVYSYVALLYIFMGATLGFGIPLSYDVVTQLMTELVIGYIQPLVDQKVNEALNTYLLKNSLNELYLPKSMKGMVALMKTVYVHNYEEYTSKVGVRCLTKIFNYLKPTAFNFTPLNYYFEKLTIFEILNKYLSWKNSVSERLDIQSNYTYSGSKVSDLEPSSPISSSNESWPGSSYRRRLNSILSSTDSNRTVSFSPIVENFRDVDIAYRGSINNIVIRSSQLDYSEPLTFYRQTPEGKLVELVDKNISSSVVEAGTQTVLTSNETSQIPVEHLFELRPATVEQVENSVNENPQEFTVCPRNKIVQLPDGTFAHLLTERKPNNIGASPFGNLRVVSNEEFNDSLTTSDPNLNCDNNKA